jgi:hypothetical protein
MSFVRQGNAGTDIRISGTLIKEVAGLMWLAFLYLNYALSKVTTLQRKVTSNFLEI